VGSFQILDPSPNTEALLANIKGLERTHPDTFPTLHVRDKLCSPSAGSTTRNGVQGGNDVDGYIDIIKRGFLGKQLKRGALERSQGIS